MSLRISTKGIYGIKAVSCLVLHRGEGPLPIRSIAREGNIPFRYLEQLMNRLRRKGIVPSIRGAGGGFMPTRPPESIYMDEVVGILEGHIPIARCLESDSRNDCGKKSFCVSRVFLNEMIRQFPENTSVSTLTDQNRQQKRIDIRS